jgi:hypothetical protein
MIHVIVVPLHDIFTASLGNTDIAELTECLLWLDGNLDESNSI